MLKNLVEKLLEDLEMENSDIIVENGYYTIPFDEENEVTMNELKPKGVALFSNIEKCPDEMLDQLFTNGMEGNLFGHRTGGATLGLDREGNHFTLRLELPYDVSYDRFYGQVESFVNFTEYWRDEIIKHRKGPKKIKGFL